MVQLAFSSVGNKVRLACDMRQLPRVFWYMLMLIGLSAHNHVTLF